MHRIIVGLLLASSLAVPVAGQSLFTAVISPSPDAEPGMIITYDVTIDTDVLAMNPATLTVELPKYTINLQRTHFDPILGFDEFGVPEGPSSERHYTWSGIGDGYHAAITHYKDCTTGTFWGPSYYTLGLRTDANLEEDLGPQHILNEPGDMSVPIHGESGASVNAVSGTWKAHQVERDTRARDDLKRRFPYKEHGPAYEVEMLTLYTDDALADVGTILNVECIAVKGISDINEVLRNSNVNAVVRSVGIKSLSDFEESTDANVDRARLHENAQLQRLLANNRADAVTVLLKNSPTIGRCGYAYTQRPECWEEESGSVIGCDMGMKFASYQIFQGAWNCVLNFETSSHEFGHLASAEHQSTVSVPEEHRAQPYCEAHKILVNDEVRRTSLYVLSTTTPKIPHYSDSQINYDGVPTGVADTRENARAIREVIPVLSILGTVIYADDFESGDASRWSEVVGLVP